MTTEKQVSVIEPVGSAIEKVTQILFKPFDLGRWFVIGFCAWLAYLMQGGFGGFNFPFDNKSHSNLPGQIGDFITNNLTLIIIAGSVLVFVGIIVMLILCWLSSRGKFMFLYCVAQNKAEVKNPWHKFAENGNSLFLFRIITSLIFLFFLAVTIVPIVILVLLCRQNWPDANIAAIAGIVLFVFIFLSGLIAFAVMFKFTFDFVVPIMYLRNCGCVEGWRQFLSLLSENKGRFLLYILFQIVIAIAIGIIITMVICLTCCIACCLFIIPFIGTVFLLPIFVFKQAYALMYLRQYGTDFDVFVTPAPVIQNP